MIMFKTNFEDNDMVRLFEPGSAKWIELTINAYDEPAVKFRSTKEQSTAVRKSEVDGHLLDKYNINWYDIDVYPANTIETTI